MAEKVKYFRHLQPFLAPSNTKKIEESLNQDILEKVIPRGHL